jgi:integrase/recombinase XerD
MPPLRQHMLAALQRSGKGERTQAFYVREVRLLAQFYHTSPDRISEQELQHYCLYRQNGDGLAPASLRLCSSGIRFFSPHVLQRAWATLSLLRAHTTYRLPAVRSGEEVTRLLTSATPLHHRVYCTTVSRLGLRLPDALVRQVSDIDGPRLQVHDHRGQGATDRSVPLPEATLARRRTSWQTPRHPTGLLPATGRDHPHSPPAASPMRRSSGQGALRTAQHRAGLTTTGVAIHPLRHAYATPLRTAGGNPRLIQRSLGHTHRATTMISLHLTPTGQAEASRRRNTRMHGLRP